ncbi:MAG: GNAT family N-acetyltransferase [Lautropia sp.]|nr:GNAT family N-acetyltransferase [Lautropia sp.]
MSLRILPLNPRVHDRRTFSCGVPALDTYLQERAGQHQRDGIATTHVLVDDTAPTRILGYSSLSAAQLHLSQLQEADRKRLPAYPVPAIRMGRLAVATDEQGKGHGQLLVGHVVNLAQQTRQTLGVRVLIVDAKDERAAVFYLSFGFRRTSDEGLSLYLTLPNPASDGG